MPSVRRTTTHDFTRRAGLDGPVNAVAIGRDLRFASVLQSLMRTPLGARAAIAAAGLTPWTRRNFARWMWEDYPRAVLATPDRWRRGVFTAPGAAFAAPDTRPG